ncbi:hypothetical protein OF820_08995 [Oceanotoga sp. DSM 15011]|jgi:hypothetical protein|uniref:Antitoxin VbhA domain-containing protein n=1 Tax=Oceanotoga teriensis TaxID=515440 RepID=A0AA45C4J4_9BACT|nr:MULTISPECIES: hypothetical protein [Oceanotoga]MDN5342748.1 hypothetical protein [Oceanotoga sp.]MDO7975771.1 hypothetical protein [Oceanotoga teriensis]PWJ85145.1 hypothetical protein C7380_1357 [Oceanotoga teriensis]UYO99207.1 hypothetical protein OF820_08995 [Oceanotoga sp. DSM 15011]
MGKTKEMLEYIKSTMEYENLQISDDTLNKCEDIINNKISYTEAVKEITNNYNKTNERL